MYFAYIVNATVTGSFNLKQANSFFLSSFLSHTLKKTWNASVCIFKNIKKKQNILKDVSCYWPCSSVSVSHRPHLFISLLYFRSPQSLMGSRKKSINQLKKALRDGFYRKSKVNFLPEIISPKCNQLFLVPHSAAFFNLFITFRVIII